MFNLARQLEPLPRQGSGDAEAGVVHDPLWFLCRQWQLGEFQGENASTPVKASFAVSRHPIVRADTGGALAATPPEAVVEAGTDDWWTLGRRLRIGARIARHLGLEPSPAHLIADPPPPYDAVSPAWDGRALVADPALTIDPALLGEIPASAPSSWVPEELIHERDGVFTAGGSALGVRGHRGGPMDWYSVDAADPPPITRPALLDPVVPARLEYPGMPRTGVWELEDPQADIGGFAPDAAHSATAIMTALFFSHRDEWFDVPISATLGQILRIVEVEIVDSFGEAFTAVIDDDGVAHGHAGLLPPSEPLGDGDLPWGLFHTRGLAPGELISWQSAPRPLHGEVLERVQFGVDDQSNIVWAVERRLGERDTDIAPPPDAVHAVAPPADSTRAHGYRYLPSLGAAPHWIPYTFSGDGPRLLHQRGLADLSADPPKRFDPARAEVLRADLGAHTLTEAVIPLHGLEVERRWLLARDGSGNPHLWIRRSRRPLLSAPARLLRFDVAAPTGAEVN